jgi:hypothetical protein
MTTAWQLRPGVLSRAAIDGVAGGGGGTPGTVARSAMIAGPQPVFVNVTTPSRVANADGVMVDM